MKRMNQLVSSRMRTNGRFNLVRRRAHSATAAYAALRAYLVQEWDRRRRFDPDDDRARAALQGSVAARDPARQLGLPDHAQPVDRHGPVALAQGTFRSAGAGSRAARRGFEPGDADRSEARDGGDAAAAWRAARSGR